MSDESSKQTEMDLLPKVKPPQKKQTFFMVQGTDFGHSIKWARANPTSLTAHMKKKGEAEPPLGKNG